MPSIISKDMNVHMATQFVESFTEQSNTIYYMTASKSTEFASDEEPPTPTNSVYNSLYKIYDEMIFGSHIKPSDISYMIKYNKWESGKSYDMYDDKDDDMFTKPFYVVSAEPSGIYSVFKCIYNGRLTRDSDVFVPTVFDQPLSTETHAGDNFYRTADGYVWKLMYTVNRNEYEKFATDEYIPVKIDTAVSNAAVDGSIEQIVIDNPGHSYNAYAYGTIKQAAIAGNNLIFSLQTDNSNDILTFDIDLVSGSFVEDHNMLGVKKNFYFKLADGTTWTNGGNAVYGTYYSINSTIVRIILSSSIMLNNNIVKLYQTSNNLSTGTITAIGDIESIRRDLIPDLSSNNDFYTNSSFYIRHGAGAGELRNITDYLVVGNERRIVVNEEFTIMPDTTSRFEIGPRVLIKGDGFDSSGTSDAKAVAVMTESSNSIHSIEIIDSGKNYSYATVTVLSNTGYMELGTGDVINANTAIARVIISPKGGHGKDAVKELAGKYVCISSVFDNNISDKFPSQNDYRCISVLKDPLFYRIGLTITDNALLFNDGEIVTQLNSGATGEVFNRNGVLLTLANVKGFFITGEDITTNRGSNDVTSTIVSIDKTLDIIDQRLKCAINITNTGPTGNGFILDEPVIQTDTGATGIIHSKSSNRIDLVETTGVWNSSDDSTGYIADLIGTISGASAKVSAVVKGDLVDNSGDFLYIENFSPVYRSEDQKEQIKLIMEF